MLNNELGSKYVISCGIQMNNYVNVRQYYKILKTT